MTQTQRPALPPELDPRGPRHRAPQSRPTRRGGVARWLSWLAVTLSAVLFVGSVGGYVLVNYYNGRIGRVNIRLPGAKAVPDTDGSAQNFLLVGSDTRNFAGGQQFQAAPGSADYTTGQRSDTTMLVHVPAGSTARATMVSFPRDSYVQIPAYTDPKTGKTTPAHMAKFNAAYAEGGAPLLTQMVENMTGLKIDHYLEVNFAGFQGMVNALGGVNLCVGTTRHDKDSGDHLTAGMHYDVNGATALAFVRDRKGLPNGDIDRIKDQQYFLSQVLKKVLSAGTLLNPFKLNSFLQAVTANVKADNNFSFDAMRKFALRMRHLDPAHVKMETLPFTTESATRTINGVGQSVVLIDHQKAQALFDSLRQDGSASPSASPSSAPTTVSMDPSQVSVSVYNATGRGGLASRTSSELASEGFGARVGGNSAHSATTEVRYGPGEKDAAQTVAAAVPGATLVSISTPGVELVLGDNFSGVRPVTGPNGTTATPSSPPSAAPSASSSTSAPQTAANVSCAP